jgi:1-acyl-sn-glycerol-3-phosphate acyltransferase
MESESSKTSVRDAVCRHVAKYAQKKLFSFLSRKQAAMFVANHNSWMDIPFLGYTIGWRNYKLISKKELGKVPILGKAIREGGHIMVDRSNRRSQLKTLKDGMQLLKDGVHLCTFPEGTRSRSGHLMPFKNGAFKMAHKVGAPVVPLSIVASGDAMPANWMFPRRPCHGLCKVVIHEPIESEGKTEHELAEAVRAAIISGLPENQRPE